jgi:UDP-4-amino-4,6-dideoxy-N-acetyl-beta-L-altrosamine transaminase
MIPYGRQSISNADVDAVLRVLRSDFLTQGPQNPAFEAAISNYVGSRYALTVNSATSALQIACLALGLGVGDLLWTSSNSFVASANCAVYCGAEVDFVDIDPLTYNISIDALESKLERARIKGRLPKIVIPVHFAGQSCDMAAIGRLAREFGFKVIEDASHAIGAQLNSLPIGCCIHSDISVFSFHPVKIITTAEGGALTTNCPSLATRLADLRSHGITREDSRIIRKDQGAWYYEQQSLGYNYRMTEIQAALGLSQMSELERFVTQRNKLATRYDEAFKDLPLTRPWQRPGGRSSFHLYVIKVAEGARLTRRELFDALRCAGIWVNVHYIPIHLQPFYQSMGFKPGDFPAVKAYYEQAISLPLFASLSEADQDYVVQKVREFVL